jgi:hypothetical protein
MWWLLIGFCGFLGYLPGLPEDLRLLNLFFLLPLVKSVLIVFTTRDEEMHLAVPDLPIPPPSGNALMFVGRLFVSQLAALFVPSMWLQVFHQSIGQIRKASRTVNNPNQYRQKMRYRLPFEGEWYVLNGGTTPKTSHSWNIPTQRYAYDFVIVDEDYRRWKTDGQSLSDYLCYGILVCSPADGEVVAVRDGIRDAPQVGTGWLDIFTPHFPGNTVTIRHTEGEYSFFAHLIPNSIQVQVGMEVKSGQIIGYCGNSGHSTEPHLHFHFQDHADFWNAAGLPIAFDGVAVKGQPATNDVCLIRGMKVKLPCSD